MDCRDIQIYSSAYIDNMLSKKEELDFKNHIKKCVTCSIAFENLKTVVECVNMVESVELPSNFSNELHEKLQGTKNNGRKPILRGKGRALNSIATTLLILVLSLALVSNFLDPKKEISFYGKMDDTIQEEENANINIASDETEEKTLDKIEGEESIMDLKMAPTNKNKNNDHIFEKAQRDTREKYDGNNGSIKKSDVNEKSATDKAVRSLLDSKDLKKMLGLTVVLTLVIYIIVLIYRVYRK